MKLFHIFLILFFLFLFSDLEGLGQKKSKNFQVPGRVKMDKGDPSGSKVNILNLDTNIPEKSLSVTSSGKFDLELKFQSEYKVSVSKEGYYTKDILISTSVPTDVWKKDSIFPPYYIIVSLFQKVPDAVMSFEGKPIGRISYSPNGRLDNFDSKIFIDDKDIKNEIEIALKNLGDSSFSKILIAAGQAEKQNDLNTAYQQYLKAAKLRPGDKFVKEKIKDLASARKDSENEQKILIEYDQLIAVGNENFEKRTYQQAISKFNEALKLKPNDIVAKNKIAQAEDLLNKAKAENVKAVEFDKLVASGDEYFGKKMYAEAISNYGQALNIKPDELSTKNKIGQAEELLKKAKEENLKAVEFDKLVASGDEYFGKKMYAEAISNYGQALNIKPDELSPKNKIAQAEDLLNKVKAENLKAVEFDKLVASGDDYFGKKMYAEAISNYGQALNIKPDELGTKNKIAQAEDLLKKAKEENLKAVEFNKLVTSGDDYFGKKMYAEAISNYGQALNIKPDELGTKNKIAQAEDLLKKAKEENLKAVELKKWIASGDEFMLKQKFTEAVSDYKEALKVNPGNSEIASKIASAEKSLIKMEEEKVKKEEDFMRLMTSGDKSLSDHKYNEAIIDFKAALNLISDNNQAKSKLELAQQLLDQANTVEAKRKEDYTRLIASGDESISKTLYAEAISTYQSALKIYPLDPVALAKISSAEKMLSSVNEIKAKKEKEFLQFMQLADKNLLSQNYNEALSSFRKALLLKPEDNAAKEKVQKAEKLLADATAEKERKNEEFTKLVNSGDENVGKEIFSEAVNYYKRALTIKPDEANVLAKLKAAEKSIIEQNRKLVTQKGDGENLYQENILKGDDNFSKAQWSNARFYYIEALKIKLNDQYAINRLEACDKMIADNVTIEKIKEYQNLIARANVEFQNKNYTSARFYYRNSLTILPWENLPQEKLREIDKIYAEKLTESERLLFKENQEKADLSFVKKEYALARFYYNKANEISLDEYNLSRLKQIENIVSGSEKNKVDSEYNDFIKKATEAYNQKNISLARFYYQKASSLKPEDPYSKEQLGKLNSSN